jgi:aminopeptidase-like protein
MGCSSNPNIVSFSPSGDTDRQYNIPSSEPSISPYHMTLPTIHYHDWAQNLLFYEDG